MVDKGIEGRKTDGVISMKKAPTAFDAVGLLSISFYEEVFQVELVVSLVWV